MRRTGFLFYLRNWIHTFNYICSKVSRSCSETLKVGTSWKRNIPARASIFARFSILGAFREITSVRHHVSGTTPHPSLFLVACSLCRSPMCMCARVYVPHGFFFVNVRSEKSFLCCSGLEEQLSLGPRQSRAVSITTLEPHRIFVKMLLLWHCMIS